jgi:hypothetical protein
MECAGIPVCAPAASPITRWPLRVAWLWDYCRQHHLDLVVNDETVLRLGAEIEDESASAPQCEAETSRS